MSCSENRNFSILTTTSAKYPKIALLPVPSQNNIIACFEFQIFRFASTPSLLAALLTQERRAV